MLGYDSLVNAIMQALGLNTSKTSLNTTVQDFCISSTITRANTTPTYSATNNSIVGATFTITGNTTNGSAVISGVSGADIAKVAPGEPVTGTGIPAGTHISAVGTSTITITQNATATNTGVTLTCTPIIVFDFSGEAGVNNGHHIRIEQVWVKTSGYHSSAPNFALTLFNQPPFATSFSDGTQLDLSSAQAGKICADFEDISVVRGFKSSRAVKQNEIVRYCSLEATSKKLYGMLQVANNFTGIANETFEVNLKGVKL